MTLNSETAQQDLAYLRALVDEPQLYNKAFGLNYLAAGLLYGAQCALNGLLLAFRIDAPTFVWMLIGFLPTVLFLAINITTALKLPGGGFGTGVARRAITAAFAGAGAATAILAGIFGWIAFQRADWSIWFLFPIIVCAVQGAVWSAATIIRRRAWYGVTAAGWFVAAIALAPFYNQAPAYLIVLGLTFFGCMVVPGYIILKKAPTS